MRTQRTFRKFAVSTAIALLLVVGYVWPIHAGHLNFTLYNDSSQSILNLYVSPAQSGAWGRDVLGQDVLRRGGSTRITFPGQTPNSPCMWDIMIVYSNLTTAKNRFDLCTVKEINAR
jgi:hypothetical protein